MELVPSPHSLEERLVLLEERYGGEKTCWNNPDYEQERQKVIEGELARNPVLQAIKEGTLPSLFKKKVLELPFRKPTEKNVSAYNDYILSIQYYLHEIVRGKKVEDPELHMPSHEVYVENAQHAYALGLTLGGIAIFSLDKPFVSGVLGLAAAYFFWKSKKRWYEGYTIRGEYLNEVQKLKGGIDKIRKHAAEVERFGFGLFPEAYVPETTHHPM